MNRATNRIVLFLSPAWLWGMAIAQEKTSTTTAGQVVVSAPIEDEELKELQVAADADLNNTLAQLSFAQRLFEKGKPQQAWHRLQAAYEKNPDHKGVLMGLLAVMDDFKKKGGLNVGTSENQFIHSLGTPHQTVKMPWGVRYVYGVMAIDCRDGKIHELVKLAGATDALFDASHVVEVDLGIDPVWHVGIRQKGDGLTTAFLYPEGKSIVDSDEIVAVERFVGQAEGKTIDDVSLLASEQIKAAYASASAKVFKVSDTSAVLAVKVPASENQSGMEQLVRLWVGSRDVHRLAYTHYGENLSSKQKQKWERIFQAASVKAYDPSVSKTSQAFSPPNQVKALAEAIRADLKKATAYKPTEQALKSIAANEEAYKKLQAYCDTVYREVEQAGPPAKPSQTEIIVIGPALEDLPGGYRGVRDQFKPDVKFYGFKYVVPGETSGMAFNGAFEIEGKWYFLPKAFRAFQP